MNNILYTVTGSKACAEIVEWLNENNIPFKERKISKARPLQQSEIISMINISDNGFEDIIKRNKKTMKLNGDLVQIEDLSTREMIFAIIKQPNLIRTPILLNSKKMVVGCQINEMRIFIPRGVRKKELERIMEEG